MKKSRLILSSFLALGLVACSSNETGSDTITGTYSYYVGGYDWGAGVDKAVLSLDYKISEISADDLDVMETKEQTDWSDPEFAVKVVDVDRTVTDIYLCDADGNPVDSDSEYVAVELYVSPDDGNPINYSMVTSTNTWSSPYTLTFTLTDTAAVDSLGEAVTSFTIDAEATGYTTAADMFAVSTYDAQDGTSYNVATYEPAEQADTLFVWLHGGGEGQADASDAYVPLLANKATVFASEEFQTEIGGAAILVPQSPTMWMDGTGNRERVEDDSSVYTESLMELIDSYKTEYGATQVVVAGCSNGGFMTLDLMMNYPDYFTAGVPICEGKLDEKITDAQIDILKDQAMFFIYAENDTTLTPEIYSVPTLERLNAAGASNLMVFSPENVIDTSGMYTDADGNPHQYSGHWSWIYFYNNEAMDDTTGQTAWSWIADQLD